MRACDGRHACNQHSAGCQWCQQPPVQVGLAVDALLGRHKGALPGGPRAVAGRRHVRPDRHHLRHWRPGVVAMRRPVRGCCQAGPCKRVSTLAVVNIMWLGVRYPNSMQAFPARCEVRMPGGAAEAIAAAFWRPSNAQGALVGSITNCRPVAGLSVC